MSVFVIADLCSNAAPFGSERMDAFLGECSRAGADAAKIQLFTLSHFPQEERESKRRGLFRREEMDLFVIRCHHYGLKAGVSVFDENAVDVAVAAHCDFLKLATREQSNWELYELARSTKLPIYRSVDARPWCPNSGIPSTREDVVMGCVPVYPAFLDEPIRRFRDLGPRFGWSSHTTEWSDCINAVRAGAVAIEKHIAHSASDAEAGWSLLPEDFAKMVKEIRQCQN